MAVTWHTLRRYFTGIDIAAMRELGHPLDDYQYVVQNANALLKRLADGSMPPPPFKRWPQNRIDDFQEWIDAGFPYMPKEKDIAHRVTRFIGLSEYLTGFDNLREDPQLATKFLDRLTARVEEKLGIAAVSGELKTLLDNWDDGEPKDVALNFLRHEKAPIYYWIIKALLHVWYTGSFLNDFGFPEGDNGNPDDNQWTDGLMWRAGLAHPTGYSTEASYGEKIGEQTRHYDYWERSPDKYGKHTGLGDTARLFETKQV